ncbi:MAG: hypothetical protein ISS71_02345 [Phycisphaerae bacterium]|nr:hypothetical protein [Phycisphaerae bacterium]
MYGLPVNFDGALLIGQIREMVCFVQYQIYLHFDEEITITIEGSFSYQSEGDISMPVRESDPMKLLGISISEVRGDTNGTLNLTFSNGETLKIYDDSQQYDSYRITYNDNDIIV